MLNVPCGIAAIMQDVLVRFCEVLSDSGDTDIEVAVLLMHQRGLTTALCAVCAITQEVEAKLRVCMLCVV
jgi:hypothetical protein